MRDARGPAVLARTPRGRRTRTALLALFSGLLVAAGLLVGASAWTASHISDQVDRLPDVFPDSPRPERSADAPTFLLVGLDREPGGEGEAELVELVHFSGDRRHLQVISMPTGLWFQTPDSPGTTLGGAYARGGAPALIGAVESVTGIRVEHYADLDFTGFRAMTEALDGIFVDVAEPYSSGGHDFAPGRQRFDGDEALAYMRTPPGAGGAQATARQHAVIQAVFQRISEQGLVSTVGRLTGLVGLLARSLRVDDTLDQADMTRLAVDLREVGEPALLTLPTSGRGVEGGQPVVYIDAPRADALWDHLRSDTLSAHVADFTP
jgi:LCP family protein required for cell wall assembly